MCFASYKSNASDDNVVPIDDILPFNAWIGYSEFRQCYSFN